MGGLCEMVFNRCIRGNGVYVGAGPRIQCTLGGCDIYRINYQRI